MINRPHTVWYDQGRLAQKLGKDISDCPYKEGTYGWSEWIRGYNDMVILYAD
jgi:hypothetical protein